MIRLLICFFLLGFVIDTVGDQIAVTSDGKEVLLKSDGTWSFMAEEKAVTKKAETQDAEAKRAQQNRTDNSKITNRKKTKTRSEETSLIELVAADSASNFRSVKWYMTKEDVRKVETAKLKKAGNDTLEYELEMFGYLTQLFYIFSDNQLMQIRCNISQPHSNPNRYFRDYQNLKNYLIPIHGSPTEEVFDWTNEIYKEDESRWGFAASIGFLTCTTEWVSGNTQIEFILSGRNHSISTTLEYSAIHPAK